MTKQYLLRVLEDGYINSKSVWDRAVWCDAFDMVAQSEAEEFNTQNYEKILLNGASSWHEYSWGGCALIYNMDIAKHYCTPSELKRTREGLRRPNREEDWLDVQARALRQACRKVGYAVYRDNMINRKDGQ
ncbi:MAG: hypothetical protein J6A59_03760 [Lachnospiraceae bacterium]|nr:hypothetical protein [Lachnospiraceae bacterium]